jgi:rfaE bifunctional protein nucleotidyltransferase chain/domain
MNNKKIVNLNSLKELREKYKKIVLVHGVFDLIHKGHLDYFREAKALGEILVASVTDDKYVNKGFNRPYFNSNDRIRFLSELDIIDYVVLSKNKSSFEIINSLKPNYYVKGPDYLKKKNDKAGNLDIEKNILKKNGGKIVFTTGPMMSSTKIINENFDEFKIIPKFLKQNNIFSLNKNKMIKDLQMIEGRIKRKKILILGEIILDNYLYSTPLGTPSKENILSVNYIKKKEYLGGSIPILNNISELYDDITFVSFYKNKYFANKIKNQFKNKAKINLIYEHKYKEIKKNRYIDINNKRKFFEFYDFNNKEYNNVKLINFLNKNLKKFDKVIVCDFGHGLISDEVVQLLQKKSRFLCLNVQTNSGNRGFNLFSKFQKADLLVLDEPEIRLGLSARYKPLNEIIYNHKLKKFKNIMITLGVNGLALRLYKEKKYTFFPALASNIIDTIGAGDAVYSYSSMLVGNTKNNFLIGFFCSLAGAIKTGILGHSDHIKIDNIKRSFESLIK